LRDQLHRLVEGEGRHAFFFHLAQGTLEFRPPRGFFGNIQFEAAPGHTAAFNVKAAILPLVNFARLYALQCHFSETNTLERLRRLRDQGLLIPSSYEELAQAYAILMHLRLTHQAARVSRGLEPDNFIDLAELTQIERSALKKVFADITVFQARLRTDFARTA
jgi:CBS domain-containing protein